MSLPSYNVYTTSHVGVRAHIRLFIKTDPSSGSGQIHHVTGTVLQGTTYETRPENRPDLSPEFIPGSQKYIGRVAEADMGSLETLCRSVPPPEAQLNLNDTRKDPGKPVRRCGEWVREVVEVALRDGLVIP